METSWWYEWAVLWVGIGWWLLGGGGRDAVRGEEGEDLGFWEVKTQRFEGDFKFVVVYPLVFVEIK